MENYYSHKPQKSRIEPLKTDFGESRRETSSFIFLKPLNEDGTKVKKMNFGQMIENDYSKHI